MDSFEIIKKSEVNDNMIKEDNLYLKIYIQLFVQILANIINIL